MGSHNRPGVYRYYFTTRLLRPTDEQAIKFTVKFRTSSSSSWKWVKDESSTNDGELYFQTVKPYGELKDYLGGLYSSPSNVKNVASEVPDTRLWYLTDNFYGSANNRVLGTPTSISRWFSLVRIWSPWLAPRHGVGTSQNVVTPLILFSFRPCR